MSTLSRAWRLLSKWTTYYGAHDVSVARNISSRRPRVIIPAGVGFEIHVGQLPGLAPVIDARFQPSRLLLGADLQPILQGDNSVIDNHLLKRGHHLQKPFDLFLSAKPHHPLDTCPGVPAAVEDHDLPSRGQMRNVALGVHSGTSPVR